MITTAELVRRASAVISGDTGFLHYATSIGVPTISYWGATEHRFTSVHQPFPERNRQIVSHTECSPCYHTRPSFCGKYDGNIAECVASGIKVEDLANSVQEVIAEFGLRTLDEAQTPSDIATINKVLDVGEAVKLHDTDFFTIAFLMDISDTFTGGGFHIWNLADSFSRRASCRVWLFVDSKNPVYLLGTLVGKNVNVVYDPQYTMAANPDAGFDVIVGTPQNTGILAVDYAKAAG